MQLIYGVYSWFSERNWSHESAGISFLQSSKSLRCPLEMRLTFSVRLSLKRLFAWHGKSNFVLSWHLEAVSCKRLEASHQKSGLIDSGVNFSALHAIILPCPYPVADDRVMVVIERCCPCQQNRSACDAGNHGPVGWRLWSILYHKLHRAGVKTIVDETIVNSGVLNSNRRKLQLVSMLVESSSEWVIPLGDLVIIAEEP